jgi:hypothetical protein
MADMTKKTQETRESAMAGQTTNQGETTTRGSSSQQAGRTGGQTTNRSDLPETSTGMWTGAPPEPVTHQPGQERSEEAGMEQMSRMYGGERREGTGRGMSDYTKGLCDREQGMSERERGMSERERGMSERERAMYDRECAMTERERSSAWGGGEGQSSTGGMTSGQSRTGGKSGSSQTQMNR